MSVAKKVSNYSMEYVAKHISEIISKETGNVLGDAQQVMVSSKLKKRMIDLGNIEPGQYYDYLYANYKSEMNHLVGLITTHHTFFFREFIHFEFVQKNIHSIVERVKARGDNKVRIYSAACSRGHEVYSLAMFMRHLIDSNKLNVDFEILGTDIDSESVNYAKNGVYLYKEVISIPRVYLGDHWQRGTGEIKSFAKVKDTIRKHCKFDTLNLLDLSKVKNQRFDMIFCRNVFIYFTEETIKDITLGFRDMLHPGGLLVTGLSESLKIIDIENMDTLATSVYSFDKAEQEETQISSKSSPVKSEVSKLMAPSATKLPSPIKVLAVDDSKSVLKLLGKIFDMDKDFELVGTAENGLEAQEFLKTNKVDMMTLDIHMPEMDGVQYLEKNFGPSHPKVLVISSASREDTRYAQKTIELGASDFVEKPALNNIKEKAEEIKMKIKMSLMTAGRVKTSLDTSFKKDFTIKDCDQKARVFFANFSDLKKVSDSIKELKGDQPPICLVFEGNENYLDVIKSEMSKSGHYNVEVLSSETKEISKGRVYICDFKTQFDLVSGFVKNRLKNVSVFGVCSSSAVDKILGLDNFQLLVEDLGDMNKDLREVAHDVFPWTSFPHVGTEFLSGEDE